MPGSHPHRHAAFALFLVLSLIAFRRTLFGLAILALHDGRYALNLVVPFLGAFLICLRRGTLAGGRYGLGAGLPVAGLGAMLAWLAVESQWPEGQSTILFLEVSGLVLVWIGGFITCYGTRISVALIFPLCFLLWMAPIPAAALDKLSLLLQEGSAGAAHVLINLTGVPVLRHGFTFSLPGLDVMVAEQCSGIRSGLALLIAGSLACYALLQSWWGRTCFMLALLPVAIFKNAVRIVTISYLGLYVNQGFLHGRLHRYGGLPFAMVAVALLAPLLLLLRWLEENRRDPRRDAASAAGARRPELHGQATG
jgi:exosortase